MDNAGQSYKIAPHPKFMGQQNLVYIIRKPETQTLRGLHFWIKI